MVWDEDAIAEHDKERGRKKIIEPKTPYIRSPQCTSSASEGEQSEGELSESRNIRFNMQIQTMDVGFASEQQGGSSSSSTAPVPVAGVDARSLITRS